jgi:poly(beta-D-mannuronate) lyase
VATAIITVLTSASGTPSGNAIFPALDSGNSNGVLLGGSANSVVSTDASKSPKSDRGNPSPPGKNKPASDTVAPQVSAFPSGGVYSSDQWIRLWASEAATIYYTVDGTAPSTSSRTYTSEIHVTSTTTLRYFAIDTSGNAGNLGTQSYVIDLTPPSVVIDEPVAGSLVPSDSGVIVVKGSAFDAESEVELVELRLDSGSYFSASETSGDWSLWSAGLMIDAEGPHSITARAVDKSGRTSIHMITVTAVAGLPESGGSTADTTAPETQIISAVDGMGNLVVEGGHTYSDILTISFHGTDDLSVWGYEGRLDGGSWAAVQSPASLVTAEGSHVYEVQAIDSAGNVDPSPASISWTVISPQSIPEPEPAPANDLPAPLRTIGVASVTELMGAIKNAKPGDHIVVKAGQYDTSQYFASNGVSRLLVTVDGTASDPIVVRAEAVGSVEITGPASFYLNGASYVVIHGFKFAHSQDNSASTDDIAIRCNDCEGVRFAYNVFTLTTQFTDLSVDVDRYHSDWLGITGTSSDNRIDHNEFKNKFTRGVFLFLFGKNGRVVQNTLVDHNLFSGQSYAHGNGGECFRIGNSALGPSPGNMIMEYNTFENCDGDREAITIKASNNMIRYNTFRNNDGSLTFRHGNNNVADGNIFIDGNNGIRVYGHDHRIINNYFANNPMTVSSLLGPIVIGKGTVENDLTVSNSEHSQPRNILVAHNTLVNNRAGIVVGYGSGSYLPTKIVIANNIVTGSTGKLVTINAGTDLVFSHNLLFPTGSATVGDVPTSGYTNADPLLTGLQEIMVPSVASPAVNAIEPAEAYGVMEDMMSNERTGMFDLGAYELQT